MRLAGSRVDDYRPVITAQKSFLHPDWDGRVTVRGEIHALGSTVMELMAGRGPYAGAPMEMNISLRLREELYPDLAAVELGDIVVGCCKGEYATARGVADRIRERLACLSPTAGARLSATVYAPIRPRPGAIVTMMAGRDARCREWQRMDSGSGMGSGSGVYGRRRRDQ